MAELIAALPEPDDGDDWSPRVAEFDLNAMLSHRMLGMLGSIFQQLVALSGNRPPVLPAFPVPVTEVDRVRERMDAEWALSMIARFAPHALASVHQQQS